MKVEFIFSTAVTLISATALWAAQPSPQAGSNLGSVTGGDFNRKAHDIIEKKCTVCHSSALVDAALSSKKDMLQIQHEMEKKGAALNANEREVLGVFWKENPLKRK